MKGVEMGGRKLFIELAFGQLSEESTTIFIGRLSY